jgi:hypothetical protein
VSLRNGQGTTFSRVPYGRQRVRGFKVQGQRSKENAMEPQLLIPQRSGRDRSKNRLAAHAILLIYKYLTGMSLFLKDLLESAS